MSKVTYLDKERGFTLVELMVVVAIIGILAAVAVPQFVEFRMRGMNASAFSDLKNLDTVQHAFFIDSWRYVVTYDQSGSEGELTTIKTVGDLLNGPAFSALVLAQFAQDSHHELPLALGNNVLVQANVDPSATSYAAVSKHLQANTMYGVGSDSNAIYRDIQSLRPGEGGPEGSGTPLSHFVPEPVPQVDVFAGPDILGQWAAM